MNSPDPDPAGNPRPSPAAGSLPAVRTAVSVSWSHAARREYRRLNESLPLATLNALVRCAARQTMQVAGEKVLSGAPDNKDFPKIALAVSFMDDAEIYDLNAAHRGKNKPTDVLSFSQLEGGFLPTGGDEILLGDVVISIETAHRQAVNLKHSLADEIAFLVVHGVLHLCGYDHDTSARRRAMWKKQDEIVASLSC